MFSLFCCYSGDMLECVSACISEAPVTFTVPLQDTTVEKDEEVTLTCETSKPGQKVTWLKNGKPFTFKDKNRYQVTAEGTKHILKIPKSVLEDTADFTVQLGDQKTTGKLTVKGKPANSTLVAQFRSSCCFCLV